MRGLCRLGRGGGGRRRRFGGGFRLGVRVFRGDFLHDRGSPLFADLASGIVDAALRQGELTTAGAGFRVEFVEGGSALFGSESLGVDAGQHGGAIRVLQEDFAGVIEGFDARGNGHVQKGAHFGLVKSRIKQADMLLDDAALGIDDEDCRQSADASISHDNLGSGKGHGIVDGLGFRDAADRVHIVIIHDDADDLELVLISFLQLDEARYFGTARSAPGSPEIQENYLAFMGCEAEVFAIKVLQLKIGGRVRIANKANDRELGVGAKR